MNTISFAQRLTEARAYLSLVLRYKWHISVGTFALMLIFTLIVARLPSVYEATTTILVDPQQVPEKYVSSAVTVGVQLNTITQQVLSRTRLQEILDKFGLYPELRKSLSQEELIEKMRGDITIQVKQGSGFDLSTFTISYEGKQPTVVATVANELAASFIQWNVNSREQQVAGTKEFLLSELGAAKRSLEQQEDRLRQFKMAHLGETPDQAATNLQTLAGLRSTLQADTDAMNRLDEEKALLTSLPEQAAVGTGAGVNRVATLTERQRLESDKQQVEANLEQLHEHYSDSYPDVIAANHRLNEINAKLKSLPPDPIEPVIKTDKPSAAAVRLKLIEAEMGKLKIEQDQIQSQIATYQARLDDVPLRDEELAELTRNYDISRQNYQSLLDKSFSIDMAADLEQKQKGERFTVLDPAQIPQKPIKPPRKMLIASSGSAALAISIFLVLVREALSPAVKTEMELESILPRGARIIGLIPPIKITADVRRARRLAVSLSLVSALLCLAVIRVIWQIHLGL